MELNRRNFIKFLVGGVVGLQATPIPWKITDDVAIWTQNWPWVPVPPTGPFGEASAVCNLCPGGCGIRVRKVDDRAVKIDGSDDYPINPGGICPLGAGGLQLLYNETLRFTGPMKRVGPRGAGDFVPIGWDEAIQTLVERIELLRKERRPEALASVDGNTHGSAMSLLIERLTNAIGSPNYVRIPSIEDTYRMGNLLMQGSPCPMAYDLENSDYILSFGAGLLEGWGSPGRVMHAWSMWREGHPDKRKTRIVQVESRASNTASKADAWIAARPGTEGALALGIAHVLIQEDLYDAPFVEGATFGFDNWTTAEGQPSMGFKRLVLEEYGLEKVARMTGVEPEIIAGVARQFARARAPVAIYGKGKDGLSGSLYDFMAVQSLNALMGRLNTPGGVLFSAPLPLTPFPDLDVDFIAQRGIDRPRLDQAGSKAYPFTDSLIHNLAEAVVKAPSSPINTLLVFSANPAFTLLDGGVFREALKRIPFVVSFSPYQDETAWMADLILPDSTYLEKTHEVLWPTGLQYPFYAISGPAVRPVYDTKDTGDTVMALAKALGGTIEQAFPWKNMGEVLKFRAEGLFQAGKGQVRWDPGTPPWQWDAAEGKDQYASFDEMWRQVGRGGFWFRPVSYQDRRIHFETESTHFEFCSQRLQAASDGMGLAAMGDRVSMAHYEPWVPEVDRSKFPLLMVPYEMINLASGWIPSPPFLYKTIFEDQLLKNDSFATIHPKTAKRYGLRDRDRVSVRSPVGEVTVRVQVFEGAMPDVVYLPLGFGHTAYDEFLNGKGVRPGDVVLAGKDPVSGHPVWWHTPVTLTKV